MATKTASRKKPASRKRSTKKDAAANSKILPGMEDSRIADLDIAIQKVVVEKSRKAKAHESIGKLFTKIGAVMKAHNLNRYSLNGDQFIREPGEDVIVHKKMKEKK